MVFKACLFINERFIAIDFKQESNEYKVYAWESKGVYASKLFPLQNLSPIINFLTAK